MGEVPAANRCYAGIAYDELPRDPCKGRHGMTDSQAAQVTIQVELYGLAQIACGRRQMAIAVPHETAVTDICPGL